MLLRPLDERAPLPAVEAGAVAAAVASALAELHGSGLVHGALGPHCVLLDESGTVSLLPAADPVAGDITPLDDVAALGCLLDWLAERAPDRPVDERRGLLREPHVVELLTELARRCRVDDPADRPPARLVADVLHRALPVASHLASQSTGPHTSGRRGLLDRRIALGSVVVAVLAAAATVPADCSPPPAVATRSEPSAEAPRWSDGVLTIGARRYAVGKSGDHVLVERWACGPRVVALLRRGTGDVVAFDRLPGHGKPAVGRIVARSPGAERLAVRRTSHGCPGLAVVTADGHTRPLAWKGAT